MRIDKTDLKSVLRDSIIAVLLNNTLSPLAKSLVRFRFPPVDVIAILIELPALIVEAVSDLSINKQTLLKIFKLFHFRFDR